MSSRHEKKAKFDVKKVAIVVFLFLIIGILLYVKFSQYGDEIKNNQTQTLVENQIQENIQENVQEKDELSNLEVVDVDMPERIGNYEVLGKIEIPKIDVEKYILEYTTDESLNLSVTRFWGEGIHEPSNFSIIGHNYKGIFKDLKDLVIGDTFTLTSIDGRICTYVIYDIFIVEPDDVTCIDDSLDGRREVTLITCTPGGKKRLILKAEEQK